MNSAQSKQRSSLGPPPTLATIPEAPAWKIAAVAAACLLAGLGLISITFTEGRPEEANEAFGTAPPQGDADEGASGEAGEEPNEALAAADAETNNAPEATPDTEVDAHLADGHLADGSEQANGEGDAASPEDVEAGDDANPERAAAPPLPTAAPHGSMTRGRLAYFRCGDLADASGRCPRDRELEAAAWAAMNSVVPRCQLGLGSGEVRFVVTPEQTQVEGHDHGTNPVDGDALANCLAPYAAPLTSALAGDFILSIQFELN